MTEIQLADGRGEHVSVGWFFVLLFGVFALIWLCVLADEWYMRALRRWNPAKAERVEVARARKYLSKLDARRAMNAEDYDNQEAYEARSRRIVADAERRQRK